MIAQARSVTVLADASKFGRGGLIKVAALEAVSRVVTETEPSAEIANALRDAGGLSSRPPSCSRTSLPTRVWLSSF